VYVKDRDCRLRRASRSLARNLGFASPADLLGKSDADLFGREFAERTHLEDLRVMETDQPISGLVESRQLPDGSLNWTPHLQAPAARCRGPGHRADQDHARDQRAQAGGDDAPVPRHP
jgi:hypothetical protein